ncbi:MAG: hypothetical protein WC121_05845 [Candidatus Kapaibacterium sp.]|jgi:hypothetical protein
MKLLKISLIAILLSLVAVSCGSDNSTDPDEDTTVPDGKITVVTSLDGVEKERRIVERKDDVLTPSNYQLAGFHVGLNGQFDFSIVGEIVTDDYYKVSFDAGIGELKTGTYNLIENDGKLVWGNYTNLKYGTELYSSSSATLVITKVQYIGLSANVGSYYVTGKLNLALVNIQNENPNLTVDVDFQGLKIKKL